MARPAPLLLLALALAARAAEPGLPPAFQAILERHRVLAQSLPYRGVVLLDGRPHRAGAGGAPIGAAMTPDELDAWLSASSAALLPPPEPARAPLALPVLELSAGAAAAAQPGVFDGAKAKAQASEVPAPAAPPPGAEPGYSPQLEALGRALRHPKRRASALAKLEARFAKDETQPTGLGPEAPEALRLLTQALHEGFGGPEAPGTLRRVLAKAAALENAQKDAFAARLVVPLTVFVALSRSHAPHAYESRLYFRRMTDLLDGEGRGLGEFLREKDPQGKRAAAFLLRAHAYDSLIPYLNRRPEEARALAESWFSDGGLAELRPRAARLEGFITQLALQGGRSGALDAFVEGLEARAAATEPPAAARVALYLAVNEGILPKRLRPRAAALAAGLPPGLLEDAGLAPSYPQDDWPADEWRFAMHFASTGSYRGWLAKFSALGWRLESASLAAGDVVESGSASQGLEVAKDFGGLTVRVRGTLYPGDQEGFLRGAEAKRFLAAVERDLRDPAVQGVVLRNHAQFRIVNLFGKRVSPGKLLIDGSCRGAWDLQELRRRCPTCRFVVNTGTGYGAVNNEAALAVIEGLARGEGWEEIGEAWARQYPRSSARTQGPWTPNFAEALRLLEKSEASAAKSAAGK